MTTKPEAGELPATYTRLVDDTRFLEAHRAWRRQYPRERYGLLLVELDDAASVAEGLGISFGTAMVQQVALRMRRCLRAEDLLLHLGGQRMAVLALVTADAGQLLRVAAKLLGQIREPVAIGGQAAVTSASIGIAAYPEDGDGAAALAARAEAALERARRAGGDRFELFDPQLGEQLRRKWELSAHLWRAYEQGEFNVVHQPVVAAHSGQVIGTEALLRWTHPQEGALPPAQFIPLLEHSGLIVPVGEWLLRTVCGQARTLEQAGLPPLTVAANVSPRQFEDQRLVARVAAVLRETGLDPARLCLEITENLLIHDPVAAADVIRELHAMGVRVYIDDFGTGHSSIGYLQRLPVAGIKIDQSFVRGLPEQPSSVHIVRTLVSLAHNLGLAVVAEGVETAAQAAFLRELRIEHLQGFLYGPGMSLGSLVDLLRAPLAAD